MFIPANHKRKTTVDNRVIGLVIGTLQRARCQKRVVCWVEGDSTKLFPVANEGFFCENLMQRQLGLGSVLVGKGPCDATSDSTYVS